MYVKSKAEKAKLPQVHVCNATKVDANNISMLPVPKDKGSCVKKLVPTWIT